MTDSQSYPATAEQLAVLVRYLESQSDRLTKALDNPSWTPRRSHTEGDRNAFLAAANTLEQALRSGVAQGPIYLATVEACAKIAENNGWEATAAQIRALAIPSTLRQCPICARRVASPCETLAIATSCPLSSTTRGPAA